MKALLAENLIIRSEEKKDYYFSELVAKRAFWNLHTPGCSEHYLVHRLRGDGSYIPELSRVAEYNRRIIGLIMYARAEVKSFSGSYEVLTFGPLCVDPEYQKMGVGGTLLDKTLELAGKTDFKAVVIYGEPEYYPRHGFSRCRDFSITAPDGSAPDPLMCRALEEKGLEEIHGIFREPPVYSDLPARKVDEFDLGFPFMKKLRLPGQWK